MSSKEEGAIVTGYQARAVFFRKSLLKMEVLKLIQQVEKIEEEAAALDWSNLDELGISPEAWKYVESNHLPRLSYFCHPAILTRKPRLIAYYRMAATLSQKAVQRIIADVSRFEDGARTRISSTKVTQLTQLFNSTMSRLISQGPLPPTELHALLFMAAGTQVDGSWRNEIGQGAEATVRRLLIEHFFESGQVKHLVRRRDEGIETIDDLARTLSAVGRYRACVIHNDGQLLFGSEPDITLVDPSGEVAGAIEVKGGTDPAGALERLGAAGKSFENTLAQNPSARTIYVAGIITPEVENRLSRDRRFRSYYNLTQVLTDDKERERFLEEVGRALWVLPTSARE